MSHEPEIRPDKLGASMGGTIIDKNPGILGGTPVFTGTLEMELDGFSHQLDDLVARVRRRNAAREIGNVCRVVVGRLLDDDRVLHGVFLRPPV